MDATIVVQRVATTRNAAGTPVETWSDLVTLRAQVIQSSTEEFIRGAGAQDLTATVFRTWFYPGISNADRIVCAGETYDVKEIKELGRRQGMDIRAVSVSTEA
ncbi:phage head closure protein [Tardiphaga alba]|nr:phage head closure protein [Tardiphaga alba]